MKFHLRCILEWFVEDGSFSAIRSTMHSANFCISFFDRLLFKSERNNFTEAHVVNFIRTNPLAFNEFGLILRTCLAASAVVGKEEGLHSPPPRNREKSAGLSHHSSVKISFNIAKFG